MATTSVSKRILRLPYAQVGIPHQVYMEATAKMNQLKLAGTNVYATVSTAVSSLSEQSYIQLEVCLTSGNDTTLVSSFAGWAALLGLSLLDTEVATFTSGH